MAFIVFLHLITLVILISSSVYQHPCQSLSPIMNYLSSISTCTTRSSSACKKLLYRKRHSTVLSASMNNSQTILPRAAVSVVVMHSRENVNQYVLVQRGKEPNKVIGIHDTPKIFIH